MSLTQFIKTAKLAICILFWIIMFIGTLIWVIGTEGIENNIFVICLSFFVYYITIVYRENKFVFGFMAFTVIVFVIILYLASTSKTKSKI